MVLTLRLREPVGASPGPELAGYFSDTKNYCYRRMLAHMRLNLVPFKPSRSSGRIPFQLGLFA